MGKATLTILAAVIVAAGLVFYYLFFARERILKEGQNATPAAFDRTGVLVTDNPGLKPGVWYLLYEESGKPALNVPLVFDNNSRCDGNVCDPSKFAAGTKVEIIGSQQNGGQVVVSQLKAGESAIKRTRSILLYYYNPATDKDASGNIMCSRNGLAGVSRQIPLTSTPVKDAINLLIQGNLTESEKKSGLTTEFPLQGVELKGTNLKDGVLTLEFLDSQNKTSGGACRAGILWFQIEATAKQFEGVKTVRFIPETLFQP